MALNFSILSYRDLIKYFTPKTEMEVILFTALEECYAVNNVIALDLVDNLQHTIGNLESDIDDLKDIIKTLENEITM